MSKVRSFAVIAAVILAGSASAWAGQVDTRTPVDATPAALQSASSNDAAGDLQKVGEALRLAETSKAQAAVQVADCLPVLSCDAGGCRWVVICY
jgi:hypothetical protein